jgi:cytidine diphosphoramidate kinase
MKRKKNNQGLLIWITGLPGAGKSTLADQLYSEVKDEFSSIRLDGDNLRKIMGNDLGYTVKNRIDNAYRISRMCKFLCDYNLLVICSTVSLYHQIQTWNRQNIEKVIEIYINVDGKILHQRDQKCLYSKAKSKKINNLIGIHQKPEIPRNPDLVIQNNKNLELLLKKTSNIKKLIRNIYE